MRPQDWVHDVGGWAGLMQGLAGAVLPVVVAALTAWAILAGTRHHERRLADELDAKAAGRELITVLTDAGLDFDSARQAKDTEALGRLAIRLSGKILSHLPALEIVDPEFATNRLRPFAATIADGFGQLALGSDPWSVHHEESHRALVKNIGAANGLISLWLSHGRNRTSRKNLAQVPAGGAPRPKPATPPQAPPYRLY